MVVAFLESIKYVGHTYPISFLRIYMGYYFFQSALARAQGDFLIHPRLAASISEWIPQSAAPEWYQAFLENYVVPDPQWKIFAYLITYCEFLIGISFIIGFLVRPISILGIFLCVNYIYGIGNPSIELHQINLTLFITMLWMGAGRCLGFDYFFFKRQRGIWW